MFGLLTDLATSPGSFVFFAVALLVAVDIHEFAHAFVADKLGDPTPRANGRLTLNPLAHLDPVGTLALIFFRIGWGKPVPIDAFNLKDPRRDSALISLAGPASNLLMAILISIFLRLVGFANPILGQFLLSLLFLSVALAVFNLIPVPPLDGSKILLGFLPAQQAAELEENLSQWGLLLLLFLIFPLFGGQSLVSIIILPIINFIISLLLPVNLFMPLV